MNDKPDIHTEDEIIDILYSAEAYAFDHRISDDLL